MTQLGPRQGWLTPSGQIQLGIRLHRHGRPYTLHAALPHPPGCPDRHACRHAAPARKLETPGHQQNHVIKRLQALTCSSFILGGGMRGSFQGSFQVQLEGLRILVQLGKVRPGVLCRAGWCLWLWSWDA